MYLCYSYWWFWSWNYESHIWNILSHIFFYMFEMYHIWCMVIHVFFWNSNFPSHYYILAESLEQGFNGCELPLDSIELLNFITKFQKLHSCLVNTHTSLTLFSLCFSFATFMKILVIEKKNKIRVVSYLMMCHIPGYIFLQFLIPC